MTTKAPKPFPCASRPGWFDTGKTRDTKVARKALRICDTCPAIEACRKAGREGREWGIWGGETQPERWAYLGIESPLPAPRCGTEAGYRRHLDLGQECKACRAAHQERGREYDKVRRAREREARKNQPPKTEITVRPQCGTAQGYKWHLRNGETHLLNGSTCGCATTGRAAYSAKRAAEPRKKAAA
ncbi:WhiB family transcriptional regulator [Streptomyces griseoaurantiacus]|uniref:WhiB family transcriptional regulator n=1 Tax=Streptomyces griseoaurantiacus TaxID=68213 RepID=UPI0036886DE7